MLLLRKSEEKSENMAAGVVYTWGMGKSGELGHDQIDREGICALPQRVPRLSRVVAVACGERASAAIVQGGALFTWGAGRGGRLGHGNEEDCPVPRCVDALRVAGAVVSISVGESHMAAVLETAAAAHTGDGCGGGAVYCWGNGAKGCLGTGDGNSGVGVGVDGVGVGGGGGRGRGSTLPLRVLAEADGTPLAGVVSVSAGFRYCLAVGRGGELFAWGDGCGGKLGLGDERERARGAVRVSSLGPGTAHGAVASASCGSLYSAAITRDGGLLCWGYNGSGNLGVGHRRGCVTPQLVGGALEGARVTSVACCAGQISPAALGAAAPAKLAGREGPTTLATTADGRLFAWGSCHKGKLGNLLAKTLVADEDELLPYLVGIDGKDEGGGGGGAAAAEASEGIFQVEQTAAAPRWRDAATAKPISVAAAHADDAARGAIVQVTAASIHSGCVGADGQVYTWGCGSDGRMGVLKFLKGLHGQRSRMKCYVSQPTAVTIALGGAAAKQLCASRRHMICLVVRERSLQAL